MKSKNNRKKNYIKKHKNKDAETLCKNRFLNVFSGLPVEWISKKTGFCQRKSGKISEEVFLMSFFLLLVRGKNTFTNWAMEIMKIIGESISKQAIWKRINRQAVNFVRALVEEMIRQDLERHIIQKLKVFECFKGNVYIHDTTCTKVSGGLVKYFPGGSNQEGKRSAIAKTNVLYDVRKECFALFELHSYAKNDQSLSGSIISMLKEGDLLIRDLGFFALAVLIEIIKIGAYFLTKKPHNVKLYDVTTGKEINLVKLLKKKGHIDMEVFVGSEKQVRVRLVAVPVPDKVAKERIRKARNDRDKRKNHSKDYYFLLKYSIFLTNVPNQMWQPEDVVQAYGYRWRIEIIFKAWKSHFNMEEILHAQCNTPIRVECMIYMTLLYAMIFHVKWYGHYSCIFIEKYKKHISILGMAKLIACHMEGIILGRMTEEALMKEIKKHALYHPRKDRKNSMETYYPLTP